MNYSKTQIETLAAMLAENYASNCSGPVIRGLNNEENLNGSNIDEIAARLGVSEKRAMSLTIDLSTTPFSKMSPFWRQIFIRSALIMISLIDKLGGIDNIISVMGGMDFSAQEELAARLHGEWLKNPNRSLTLNENLNKPWAELTCDEQELRLGQVDSLYSWLEDVVD